MPLCGKMSECFYGSWGWGMEALTEPVSTSTFDRWVREGRFPKPVKIGARTVAWRVEDVSRWFADRGVA